MIINAQFYSVLVLIVLLAFLVKQRIEEIEKVVEENRKHAAEEIERIELAQKERYELQQKRYTYLLYRESRFRDRLVKLEGRGIPLEENKL